jgi:hypothetical protein
VAAQDIGPASAGPDFRQVSAAAVNGLPVIALMDTALPSGRRQVVVYRAEP